MVDVPGDAVVGLVFGLTGSVPPIGRGTLVGQASGRGPWSRVQIAGSAAMESFWLSREWIQRATMVADVTWPRWQLTAELRNTARADASRCAVAARRPTTSPLEVYSAAWQLTALERGALTEMGGTLMFEASLAGPLRALSGRATLRASELVVQGRRIGGVDIEAVATRGRWELTTALARQAPCGCARGLTPETGWPLTVDGGLERRRFRPAARSRCRRARDQHGHAHVSLRLADPKRFDATVSLQRLQVVNGPYELTSVRPALLECRRGACTLSELELRGAEYASCVPAAASARAARCGCG